MKKSLIALCALVTLPTLSLAQSITVGNASGAAGGPAAPLPVTVVFAQNAMLTAANAVRDIDVRITYDTTKLSITVATVLPNSCVIGVAGTIIIGAGDGVNNVPSGTLCNLTAINIAAAAAAGPTPLTVAKGVGSGCANAALGNANCTYNSGAVTIGGVPPALAPTVSPLTTPVTLTGGVGTVPVNVATAGTAGGSLGLACTIPPTGASAFAITAGANRTIAGPAALGANAPAIGLSCVPQPAITTATLSCAQTPTPGAVLAALTSVITCPAAAGVAPTATIAATTTLTGGVGTIAVNVVTAGTVGGSLALACTVPPGANAFAITAGANRTITAPATVGANAPAIGVSCTPPAGPSTTATVTCTQTAVPAGAALAPLTSVATCPGIATPITANTPPGPITLPSYLTPGPGTSSTTLGFSITGGAGQLACVATGAGYTATPNPLNMTVAGPNIVTVTYTGAVAGTFAGTLTCTPVAPASGGPFVYILSTTVGVPVVAVQVPALGNISLMLLVAGFLGLGVVLVGRRQA